MSVIAGTFTLLSMPQYIAWNMEFQRWVIKKPAPVGVGLVARVLHGDHFPEVRVFEDGLRFFGNGCA